MTAQVQAAFQQRPIKHKYVTKRGTNMLQPADVAWMHVFKLGYFNKWQQWMINEPKSFTPAGNLRSPGYPRIDFIKSTTKFLQVLNEKKKLASPFLIVWTI